MSRIAILGWGSLIWDLDQLAANVRGSWKRGGPALPVEFSRVSHKRQEALTLVIDPEHGVPVATRFIVSRRSDPDDAACDLRTREGTVIRNIGLIDLDSGFARSKCQTLTDVVRSWAESARIHSCSLD
jgi:hypothetical protein